MGSRPQGRSQLEGCSSACKGSRSMGMPRAGYPPRAGTPRTFPYKYRRALRGGIDWWCMEWPFSRVQIFFIRSGPGKPNQRKVSSFHRGVPEQKFNVNRACFPEEKHQNSQKWAKFMNFSFWPFLLFGLPGRLLILEAKI